MGGKERERERERELPHFLPCCSSSLGGAVVGALFFPVTAAAPLLLLLPPPLPVVEGTAPVRSLRFLVFMSAVTLRKPGRGEGQVGRRRGVKRMRRCEGMYATKALTKATSSKLRLVRKNKGSSRTASHALLGSTDDKAFLPTGEPQHMACRSDAHTLGLSEVEHQL